nr:hypothetical protein [Tanacetum cinerariifolium]
MGSLRVVDDGNGRDGVLGRGDDNNDNRDSCGDGGVGTASHTSMCASIDGDKEWEEIGDGSVGATSSSSNGSVSLDGEAGSAIASMESSRLLRYAKSRPNGKLIRNSILNGPYVRKMIPEPGDATRDITITETFHLQTHDELSDKELKQIEADDQAIQTILLGLPEDIYAAVDMRMK